MPESVLIKESESIAVIEVTGAVNLAKLLQSIGSETRARLVGASGASPLGVVTVVITGGLAEVQHASIHVKSLSGISDTVFFAKPDLQAIDILLKSLKIAGKTEPTNIAEWKQRVRTIEELDLNEVENWNVHELRRYARSLPDFPLKGRMISKANRKQLLALLLPMSSSSIIFSSTQQLPS